MQANAILTTSRSLRNKRTHFPIPTKLQEPKQFKDWVLGGGSKDNRSEHNRGFPANFGLIVTAREPSGLDKKNNKRNDMTSKKIRSDNSNSRKTVYNNNNNS